MTTKRARKTKWLFTVVDEPWFCLAGVWRPSPQGEAFSLLTTEPGADVAPYHSRQVVLLRRSDWAGWLGGSAREAEVLQALPAGSLQVERVG